MGKDVAVGFAEGRGNYFSIQRTIIKYEGFIFIKRINKEPTLSLGYKHKEFFTCEKRE